MDDSQVTGATSSYARKYALNGLFAIDDSRDSDVTNVGGSASGGKTDNKALSAAIKELEKAKNEAELQATWFKYPQFANEQTFIAAYQVNNNKFIYGK